MTVRVTPTNTPHLVVPFVRERNAASSIPMALSHNSADSSGEDLMAFLVICNSSWRWLKKTFPL